MKKTLYIVLTLALQVFLAPIISQGQDVSIAPDKNQVFYPPGKEIRWNIQVKDTALASVEFAVKQGGSKTLTTGKTPLSEGKGQIQAKLDEPGWLLVEVSISSANGKPIKALSGALVSPEKIQPAQPRPDDFDSFWQDKIAALAAIPMNPQLAPGDSGKTNQDYFKITMDNINGSHIRGQIARPKQGEKLPAMLIVQWAGVYPLQKSWVLDRAAEGWLVLNRTVWKIYFHNVA